VVAVGSGGARAQTARATSCASRRPTTWAAGRPSSGLVCAPARVDSDHHDPARRRVDDEPDPPVAYPQTPHVEADQALGVAGGSRAMARANRSRWIRSSRRSALAAGAVTTTCQGASLTLPRWQGNRALR
jgi:hypothetical protein